MTKMIPGVAFGAIGALGIQDVGLALAFTIVGCVAWELVNRLRR